MLRDQVQRHIASQSNGCWLWTGCVNNMGYPRVRVDNQEWLAHRYVYTQLVGEIPAGLVVDHLCRTPRCVNPAHLEATTQSVNVRRGGAGDFNRWRAAQKTACPQGHAYTPDNLRGGQKGRACKKCHRDRARERNQARRVQEQVSSDQ